MSSTAAEKAAASFGCRTVPSPPLVCRTDGCAWRQCFQPRLSLPVTGVRAHPVTAGHLGVCANSRPWCPVTWLTKNGCLISQKKLRKKLCFFAPEQADCVATSQGSRSTLTGLPALTGLWVPGLGHGACRVGPASTPCWPRPHPMPGPLGRASMWGAVIEVPLGCRHFPSDFYATTVGNEPWINLSFYDIPACWEQSKHDKTILAKLAQVKTT